MATRRGGSPRLTIGGVSIPAQRKGAPENMPGTTWWEISAVTAGKLMAASFPGKHPPRPGYEIRLPDDMHRGHPGHWRLFNRGGKYELMFFYR